MVRLLLLLSCGPVWMARRVAADLPIACGSLEPDDIHKRKRCLENGDDSWVKMSEVIREDIRTY